MSLKIIAQKAGTSISTVSRVLNHPEHTCHDSELVERIWRAAREIHYQPNTSARQLRLGSKSTEAPLIVDIFLTRFDSLDEDPFFMELFQSLQEDLLARGCLLGDVLNSVDIRSLSGEDEHTPLIPFRPHDRIQNERKNSENVYISRKKNAGLVILGKCPENLIPLLKKRYECIAGIDRNPTNFLYDEVFCSGKTAAEIAMEHLLSLGHRNIAYIGDCSYESRYIGYYQALLSRNLPLNHEFIFPTNQTKTAGIQSAEAMLMRDHQPSAIFCANDITAIGVIETLKKHKRSVYMPSIISIDNITQAECMDPMLTTIDIPKKEMGHHAISLLLGRKKRAHKENVRIELPCRLIRRDSCHSLN